MKKVLDYIKKFSGAVSETAKSIMLIGVETAVLLNIAAIVIFATGGLYELGAVFGSAAQKILVIGTVSAAAIDISKPKPAQR